VKQKLLMYALLITLVWPICSAAQEVPDSLYAEAFYQEGSMPYFLPEPCYKVPGAIGVATGGHCTYTVGIHGFDYTWGPLRANEYLSVLFTWRQRGNLPGGSSFQVYVVLGSCTGTPYLALTTSGNAPTCGFFWPPLEINLANFGLQAGDLYWVRVKVAMNYTPANAFRIWPKPGCTTIDNTTWGWIKVNYR